MSARIRIGTQGWSYPDWIGVFYPPRAKQEHYLPFYADVFDTVELDSTVYGPPKPSIARSWERHTPDGFTFAAKVPRAITHDAGLFESNAALSAFVEALEPLGDKLGPLLVQLPAEFVRDERNVWLLGRFLDAAPRDVRLAFEFRHASWHGDDTRERLAAHGAALAWTEWRDLPRVTAITADFLYCRWLGDRRAVETYDRIVIDRAASFEAWQTDLAAALPRVTEVYGYFNNHWAGHSPASAAEMRRRLGLETADPRARWPQGELW